MHESETANQFNSIANFPAFVRVILGMPIQLVLNFAQAKEVWSIWKTARKIWIARCMLLILGNDPDIWMPIHADHRETMSVSKRVPSCYFLARRASQLGKVHLAGEFLLMQCTASQRASWHVLIRTWNNWCITVIVYNFSAMVRDSLKQYVFELK